MNTQGQGCPGVGHFCTGWMSPGSRECQPRGPTDQASDLHATWGQSLKSGNQVSGPPWTALSSECRCRNRVGQHNFSVLSLSFRWFVICLFPPIVP